MILQGLLAGLCIQGIMECKKHSVSGVKNKWNMIMEGNGVKNSSPTKRTFEMLKIIPRYYGYDCIVSIPYGMAYEDLEELTPVIKSGMRCDMVLEHVMESGCAFMRLITKPFDFNRSFEPVKTKPYEIYIGTTGYYKDVISDLRTHPHVLISGATGMGKSVLMFEILLNLIINNSCNDVEIYLTQISDKKDLRIFKNAKQVKYYAQTLPEATKSYTNLVSEMVRRNHLLDKYTTINSISEYNKKFPNKKLPYIYAFADEFSFYMESNTDSNEDAFYKMVCNNCFERLVKQGRSAGIFIVTGLQRPDKENMPPIFKSQLCTRIAMGQSNTASSLVVIDDGEAVNLNPREALILLGNKRHKISTSFLDMELLEMYLTEHNVTDSNYTDLNKFNYIISEAKSYKKPRSSNSKIATEKVFKKNTDTDKQVVDIQSAKSNKSLKGVIR